MKTNVLKLLYAVALLLTGAYLNEVFRSHSAHARSSATSRQAETTPPSEPAIPTDTRDRSKQGSSEATEIKGPDPDVLRLRGQAAALKSEVAGLKAERNETLARKALEKRLGKTDLKIAETPGEPFQRNAYYRADLIQDVGNETAPAALQSFIAAMERGDYETAIKLSPAEDQPHLQSLSDKQLLGRYVTSGSQGIKIAAIAETATESEFVAEVDFGEDKPPVRAHFYTTNQLGAWKVRPNVAIEGSLP